MICYVAERGVKLKWLHWGEKETKAASAVA